MANRTTGELPEAAPLTGAEILHIVQAGNSRRLRSRLLLPDVGMIGLFPRTTAPYGWFKANGAAVSRAAYPELFEEIGTFWGAGDGLTTFNLPDFRGEFFRGWDDGRGIDVGRLIGSFQADEIKSHSHPLTATRIVTSLSGASGSARYVGNSSVSSTGAFGGTETRPRNYALLVCIKY